MDSIHPLTRMISPMVMDSLIQLMILSLVVSPSTKETGLFLHHPLSRMHQPLAKQDHERHLYLNEYLVLGHHSHDSDPTASHLRSRIWTTSLSFSEWQWSTVTWWSLGGEAMVKSGREWWSEVEEWTMVS